MPSIDSVALSTGVRLPYVEQGDPAGVPVLMLHGYTDSWRSFELLLPHLPSRVRAIAVTQRGHGDADRPATGYRPEDFVSDVAAFMDALERRRPCWSATRAAVTRRSDSRSSIPTGP